MDYLIADPNLIKKNEEKLYQEKILYMPNIWNAYSRPTDLPKINNKKRTYLLMVHLIIFKRFHRQQ